MFRRSLTSLVLTRFRPDQPAGGAALRNWQNIRALGGLGPVDVLCIGDAEQTGPVEGVRSWAAFRPEPAPRGLARWRGHVAGLRRTRHPALDAYHSPAAARWLRERLQRQAYDLVVIEELALGAYLHFARHRGARVVFDAHNVEADLRTAVASRRHGPRSWGPRIRTRLLAHRLRQAELRAMQAADLVWVCSEVDAEAVRRIYRPLAPVTAVPNGVDVDAYQLPDAAAVDANWEDLPLTLTYPGTFGYFPNEDAALRLVREVLPAVRVRRPDARVVLVGRDPTPALLAAAQQDPGVTVTGSVPSVLPYLAQPCIVALPLSLGSGTRLKIVEAFAAGRPVISTRKGAEGIAAEDARHLFLRDHPGEMAEAALQLWRSPALRRTLCANALQLAQNHYSWAEAARKIKASLQTIQFAESLSVRPTHAPATASAASAPPSS